VAFTNWANGALSSGALVISGKAMSLSYESAGGGNVSVNSGLDAAGDATNVVLTRSNGPITGLEFRNRLGVLSFKTADGDYFTHPTFAGGYEYATNKFAPVYVPNSVASRDAIFATARDFGWDYQSYGAWVSTTPNGSGFRGEASAVSVGAQTSGAAIPTGGGATFRGKAGGVYAPSYNERSLVTADATLIADFAARTATFTTTTMRDVMDGRSFDGTAVTGSLGWQPGINALTGQASTADGRLSGAAQGQFYGPSAQEVGGTFTLRSAATVTGATASALVGAFGAKR
jgi:hypothetical protein